MTDFDALLKREFAQAHEPADDGFSMHVGKAVARTEMAARLRGWTQTVGLAAAGAAVAYGLSAAVGAFGDEALATAGLEIARAHSALSEAPSMSGLAQNLTQTLGAGMSQVLMAMAVIAGGAFAYRQAQD